LSETSEIPDRADTATGKPRTKKEEQAATAKKAICQATIDCLFKYGYAETSINRIIKRAGISKGALTHHFASKEDLIVATADILLDWASRSSRLQDRASASDPNVIEADLWALQQNACSKRNKALVEILSAARTDRKLNARMKNQLLEWNAVFDANILKAYESVERDDADVIMLLTICRVFFRGLNLQDRFLPHGANHDAIVKRFIGLIAPNLKRRPRPN